MDNKSIAFIYVLLCGFGGESGSSSLAEDASIAECAESGTALRTALVVTAPCPHSSTLLQALHQIIQTQKHWQIGAQHNIYKGHITLAQLVHKGFQSGTLTLFDHDVLLSLPVLQ